MKSALRLFAAAASIGLSCLSLPALAAGDFPTKPLEIIVGQAAGGPTDLLARQIAPFMAKQLGPNASIVVLNQTGASGIIATTAVAKSKPDGYMMTLFSHPGLMGTLIGQDQQPYSMASFEFVGVITAEPSIIFVAANSPFKTLKDMIAAAKADPGGVTVGGAGIGNAGHLGLKLMERKGNITFNYIPAAGASETATQVMGSHVQAGITTVSGALSLANSGQVRIIGVASAQRLASIPDVPTFKEQGLDMEWASVRGLATSKGLPDDIKKKLGDALKAAVADPGFVDIAKKQGLEISYMDGPTFAASADKDIDLLMDIWKTSPWK
jgi:tripartite-type tricarboxylate transporter receptor subunit TctC